MSAAPTQMHVMLTNGSLFGGGAEHVIAVLARHLRAAGHRVTIAVINGGGEIQEGLEHDGFEVLTRIAEGASAFSTWKRISRLVGDRGVDIVHTHDLRSLIDVGMSRLRDRHFAHVHTFHFGNYRHLPKRQLFIESAFARVPDRLFAVGDAQRASIIGAMRLSPGRVQTLWNGIDCETVPRQAKPERESEVPLLGSMSTFGPQKGLPTLLEAAKLMRQRGLRFKLMLVGEGGMRKELEAQVEALGLDDAVEFTGWRADAAKSLLPSFDVFVQSSYWEAMSIVILEAMAARRAIVATTVGENPAVLVDGETALLVPPRDPEALATALARLIADEGLRQRLAAAAHAAYAQRFTGRTMTDRYAAAYSSCLAGRNGARRPAPAVQNVSGGSH